MGLTVNTKELNSCLTVVSKFANPKASLPILQNILLEANKNTLRLTASNLEMFVKVAVGVKTQDTFKVAIPAKIAGEIFLGLSGETVEIEKKESVLEITCGNFHSQLAFVEPGDFPDFSVGEKQSLDLPLNDFLALLGKVGFAVSSDEARPILTGVCFTSTPKGLEIVGTDGFRLSRIAYPQKVEGVEGLVIPKGILAQLPAFGVFGDRVKIGFEKANAQVSFVVGEGVASSRLISGIYPDYNKIIPTVFGVKVSVDTQDFQNAIRNASVFARSASDVVRLTVRNKTLEVVSESSVYGNQQTTVEAGVDFDNSFANDTLTVAFNYRFLLDFLKTVEGETANLSFVNDASPSVLTDPANERYTHLIMPVKL